MEMENIFLKNNQFEYYLNIYLYFQINLIY